MSVDLREHTNSVAQALVNNLGAFAYQTTVSSPAGSDKLQVKTELSNGLLIESEYRWTHGNHPVILNQVQGMADAAVRQIDRHARHHMQRLFKPKPVLFSV